MDLLDDDGLLDLRRSQSRDVAAAVHELRGERPPVPEQNDALRSWQAEPPAPSDATTCHVCQRSARMRCQACSRGACASDSWLMLGVCRACATEERVKAWREGDQAEKWL